ncbi:toxin VasX, partial [Gilliamella sp. Choc6-1]|uniref:toxin VasX n=2 Tax=unclassified Gilliamella TaxID=2685620 RepID=UPI0011478F1E
MDANNTKINNTNSEFNDNDLQANNEPPVVTPELINEAKENMVLNNGKCGACQKKGFPLFLVRKSVVPKNFKGIEWDKGMLSLTDREPEEALTHFKYAYRTLREGYVYLLLQKNKSVKEWQGTNLDLLKVSVFEVTNSGAFRLREFRNVKGSRPKALPTSCIEEGHQFKAKFITIDNKIYDKAWVAYSSYRWDKKTVEYYRQNEDKRKQRFTEIDLTQTKPEEMAASQKRSFSFNDFMHTGTQERYLLELECSDKEVLDYFDKEQQTAYQKSLKAKTTALNTSANKEIGKGVFYAQKVNLDDLINNTTEEVLRHFSTLFCTASHFNSLRKAVGGVHKEFEQTINSYRSEAREHSNYKTDEIGVILVEDSFGLAEELSVQRRQLLAPIVNGLAGRSQEQVIALQKRLSANLGKTTEKIILEGKDEIGNDIDPDIIKSFYAENILDLSYNQQYKEINSTPNYLRFSTPPQGWLEHKSEGNVRTKVAANLAGPRTKAIQNYFSKQQSQANNDRPFLYFKPETSYARNQYNSIESYKDILKINHQPTEASECILFAFYKDSVNKDELTLRKRRAAIDELKNHYNPNMRPNTGTPDQIYLDEITVLDVIGEREFAAENGLPLNGVAYEAAMSLTAKYFYFRYLSNKGVGYSTNNPPLGDYQRVKISAEQKQKILALYKQNSDSPIHGDDYDVVVVRYPNAKNILAEWRRDEAWSKKESKRLNEASYSQYHALNKTLYQNLVTYVEKVSNDYFNYVLWLFGEKNTLPFWLDECAPDTSDRHLNALSSLHIILDNDFIGSLYLDKQAELWTLLINNETSIYHHFIEGKEGSYTLFNVASGNVSEADKQLTAEVKAILAKNDTNSEAQTAEVANPLSGIKTVLDLADPIMNLKIKENVTVGAYLTEELVKLSMTNIVKTLSHNSTYKLNTAIADKHLIQAMNMFTTATHKQYTVKVPVSNLQAFLDTLGNSAKVVFPTERGGKLVTSAGKKIQGRYFATQEKFVLKSLDIKKAQGQHVELNLLMTFGCDAQRLNFESTMTTSQGTAKVEKFKEAHVISYDELQSAKLKAESQWRSTVLDTSATGIVNVLTLAYQHIQIKNLQEKLSTLTDSVLIDKVSKALFRTYLDIALTASEAAISGIKLAALFGERNESLLKVLNKLGKAGNFVGAAGKVLALVDSLNDICRANKALARGDVGAVSFMVSSCIGFAIAGLGLSFALSGPWGLVLVLAPFILNFLFGTYDDGSQWDEMDKWINRSIFGNLARNDLYPPYPISDTGNYLSEQDFYLASRKGLCQTAHHEVNASDLGKEGQQNLKNSAPTKVT